MLGSKSVAENKNSFVTSGDILEGQCAIEVPSLLTGAARLEAERGAKRGRGVWSRGWGRARKFADKRVSDRTNERLYSLVTATLQH